MSKLDRQFSFMGKIGKKFPSMFQNIVRSLVLKILDIDVEKSDVNCF